MAQGWRDDFRKASAIALVLSSVTLGIIGLGLLVGLGPGTGGNLWGIALMALAPVGIWLATRVTPEGGTTGYFDKNI
jgi:hypothetical protein